MKLAIIGVVGIIIVIVIILIVYFMSGDEDKDLDDDENDEDDTDKDLDENGKETDKDLDENDNENKEGETEEDPSENDNENKEGETEEDPNENDNENKEGETEEDPNENIEEDPEMDDDGTVSENEDDEGDLHPLMKSVVDLPPPPENNANDKFHMKKIKIRIAGGTGCLDADGGDKRIKNVRNQGCSSDAFFRQDWRYDADKRALRLWHYTGHYLTRNSNNPTTITHNIHDPDMTNVHDNPAYRHVDLEVDEDDPDIIHLSHPGTGRWARPGSGTTIYAATNRGNSGWNIEENTLEAKINNNHFKLRHVEHEGSCMDAASSGELPNVRLRPCDAGDPRQVFYYDPDNKRIYNKHYENHYLSKNYGGSRSIRVQTSSPGGHLSYRRHEPVFQNNDLDNPILIWKAMDADKHITINNSGDPQSSVHYRTMGDDPNAKWRVQWK